MYFVSFLLFGIAEKELGNATTIKKRKDQPSPSSSSTSTSTSTSIDNKVQYSRIGSTPEELTDPGFDVWNSNNISLLEPLGNGGSGAKVYRCTVKKGPLRGGTFAVKIMKDCVQEDQERLRNEIEVYKKMKSPHIVSYLGNKIIGDEIRLFIEYIPHTLDRYLAARAVCGDKSGNGSSYLLKNFLLHMQQYTNRSDPSHTTTRYPYNFTYQEVVWYLYQISIGLDTLHQNMIAHGDLKSNNIFVTLSDSDIKQCKIGDFDISRTFKHSEKYDHPIRVAFQNDVLAFGMVMFDFITLQNASCLLSHSDQTFSCPTLPDHIQNHPVWKPLVILYRDCTNQNSAKRPSSIEIKECLALLYKYIIESGASIGSNSTKRGDNSWNSD
eukprot:gene5775-7185_t